MAAPGAAQAHSGSSPGGDKGTRLYVPPPDPDGVKQVASLLKKGKVKDAAKLGVMLATPQAVWLTGGSPKEVAKEVRRTVERAERQHAVPVFVAYNLPFRDCAQYSAGGATDTTAYLAWIDGIAKGIGRSKVSVMLEPDGLGIIPFNTDINGNAEWCQPRDEAGNPQPGASPEERYEALNGAVDRLTALSRTSVYLDAGHSGWLGVGDIAQRLDKAGVRKATGFFVNASNYQPTPQLTKYGTWISQCIAFANNPDEGGWRLGNYSYCASQYYPADPNDFSTWELTDAWYAANLGSAVPTAHFVIDTSRNGQGPNDMSAYAAAPYNQPASVVTALKNGNWCNPPGAGLGLRPTTETGVPLLDAYLWIKTPGQSDGSCDIAGGARAWDFSLYTRPGWPTDAEGQAHFDPLWGQVDPAAGDWFADQALELVQKADPPVRLARW